MKEVGKELSLGEVCDILEVDTSFVEQTTGIDCEEYFTRICAWDYYVSPGCLYAALPLYANLSPAEAMKRGVKALLTESQIENYPCIIVPDVMEAYCRLCRYIKKRTKTKNIVITGSVGKTTTKDMVKSVVSKQFQTFCDVENNNMATLIGYLVQRIPSDCECYVQEVHEGDPGSARDISKIICPDIAVITNIGESHLGNFGSHEELVKGITDITAGMSEKGIVVIDGDDKISANAPWDKKVVKVSVLDKTADYYAENIVVDSNGQSFEIVFGSKKIKARINMPGMHNVTDALLAFAAGIEAGVSPTKAVQGIKRYKPKGMRQNIVRANGRTLYIDCFNAAVKSMKSSLETLEMIPLKAGGKRVVVFGDIAELGEESADMHKEVGKMVRDASADTLICFGEESAVTAEEARKSERLKVFHTMQLTELNRLVKKHVNRKDIVLFKASHSTNLVATVKANYPLVYFRTIFFDRVYRHFKRMLSLK